MWVDGMWHLNTSFEGDSRPCRNYKTLGCELIQINRYTKITMRQRNDKNKYGTWSPILVIATFKITVNQRQVFTTKSN